MNPLPPIGTMTRRAAVGALGAAAVGFAALGPRPGKERSGGRIILEYWEKWTGAEGEAMRRIVDRYNDSQSRVFVRYFSIGAIDQKALIAIAGNNPPDIIGLWNFNIPAYAESGAIIPLDALAAEHSIRREDYGAAVWPLVVHRGRLWGLVSTCGSLALFYNKTLFREAGLDPERPPRTIDELDECNARLTVVRGGAGGGAGSGERGARIERMGFIHTEPDWWTWPWGYFFGGSLYDAALDRATCADAGTVAGYRWVQKYPERYGPTALINFKDGLGKYGTAEHPFLVGKVAMEVQGPWLANRMVEFRPDLDYGVAPFPVERSIYDAERPIGLLDADVLVIPRGAPHPEESFAFIAYVQRPEIMEELSMAHCKNSPRAVSSAKFLREHPNRYVAVHDEIAKSPRAFMFPRTRVWPQYEDEFRSGFARMWRLEERAEKTLADIQARAQAQLDRVAEQRARRAEKGGGAG